MGVQQLSQPPIWSSPPSCLDSLPFTPVFVPKAGVETVLEVTWLWSHSPRMFLKAQFPPSPFGSGARIWEHHCSWQQMPSSSV